MTTKQTERRETQTPSGLTIAVAILCGLITYGQTVVGAAAHWSHTADEQHGFLVIPFALLLLYLRRSEFPTGTARLDLRGLLLVAVATGMKLYGEHYVRPWMDMWSLPIWIAGAVWLFGGAKILRWAIPPITFLFFMAGLPGQLQTAAGYPLQVIAATGAGWLLQALGQPAFVAGTTILLGDQVLDVERACGGLRMFQGMLAVAFAWSLFCRYRLPRFLITMAIAPLIAIGVNILRIVVTGLLFRWVGTASAQVFSHDWAGILMIPVGALIFFLLSGVIDHLITWHRERPDRRLVTSMAALIGCVLAGAAGYAIHDQQQQRAIGLVLEQARERSRSDNDDDRTKAVEYYQRYLSLRDTDSEVISELAKLHAEMGDDRIPISARLHELAWRYDRSRQVDAVTALVLMQRLENWQDVWKRSGQMLPSLSGEARVAAMRLRTLALAKRIQTSVIGSELNDAFLACREGVEFDSGHFEHMWQLALLTRSHPEHWREDDATPRDDTIARNVVPSEQLTTNSPEARHLADDRQDDLLQVLAGLDESDAKAIRIVERSIVEHPREPRPLLYRISLLQSAMNRVGDQAQYAEIDRILSESLNKAILIIERMLSAAEWTMNGDVPPNNQSADCNVSDLQVTAAIAYQMAGERSLNQGQVEEAKSYLSRSQRLNPRNHRVYPSLARTIPLGAPQERIELFQQALDACGATELTLVLPLAESYIAVGRQADAEELLQPLERLLPRLERTSRGRVELLLASARAGGLAQQQRQREAAELLASTLRNPSVVSQRRRYAALYAQAQFQLGELYRTLGQDTAAMAAFREGGRLATESPIWNLDAARAYEATGNLTEALQHYERAALAVAQQQPAVYLSIARVLLAQQRELPKRKRNVESARKMIGVAAERGADTNLTTAMVAESFVVEEDLDSAMRVIEQQLQKTPDALPLRFSRAMVCQLSGNVEAAIEESRRYEAIGATAAEGLLLRVLIFERSGQLNDAADVIEQASRDLSEEALKDARTRLVIGMFREGQIDPGVAELRQLAVQYRHDFPIQRLAAHVFGELRMNGDVETIERNLKNLEGSEGMVWRAARAARLLRIAEQTQEVSEAQALTTEATDLIRRLQRSLPTWPETSRLQGQLAANSGHWTEALAAYMSAWSAGARDADLASRILIAMYRTGQDSKVAGFISRLEELVPRSTTLFDRAMPEYVRGNRADFVLKLARRWAKEDPTSNNLVRLGQTLMAIVAGNRFQHGTPARDEAISEAEAALSTAIALDGANLDAWIAIFQLYAGTKGNRSRAIENLRQLSEQVSIDPLQKSFVLAQLNAVIGENSRAGKLFDTSVQLAEQAKPEVRQRVLTTAMDFFASRRIEHAVMLCRSLLSQSTDRPLAKRYMVRLLAMQRKPESIDEAIELQRELYALRHSTDVYQARMLARLLAIRVELEQAPQRDRTEAIDLLEGITPRTADDAFMLAELYAANNQPLRAFNLFRENLRLELPTSKRLIRFLGFWNDAYASEGTYRPIADQYLDELTAFPNAASDWLRLSLDRLLREEASRNTLADEERYAVEAKEVAAGHVLDRFVEIYIENPSDAELENPTIEMLEGLSEADRMDLIPDAWERLNQFTHEPTALARAFAVALIRLAGKPKDAEVLVSEAMNRFPPDMEQAAETQILLGDAMYVAGSPDLAVPYYRSAIRQSPHDANALNNLAIVLAECVPENLESRKLMEQVIEIEPENAERRDTMLVIALLDEDWELAESVAETLVSERSGPVLLHRAFLRLQQGRPHEAGELFANARDDNVETQLLAPVDKRMFDALFEQSVSPSRLASDVSP